MTHHHHAKSHNLIQHHPHPLNHSHQYCSDETNFLQLVFLRLANQSSQYHHSIANAFAIVGGSLWSPQATLPNCCCGFDFEVAFAVDPL